MIRPRFQSYWTKFWVGILRTLVKFVEIGLRIIYRKSRVSNYGSQKITEMPACWYCSNINKGIFPFVLKINDIHNINHTQGVMICKITPNIQLFDFKYQIIKIGLSKKSTKAILYIYLSKVILCDRLFNMFRNSCN